MRRASFRVGQGQQIRAGGAQDGFRRGGVRKIRVNGILAAFLSDDCGPVRRRLPVAAGDAPATCDTNSPSTPHWPRALAIQHMRWTKRNEAHSA